MSLDDLEPMPEDMLRLLREGRPGTEPPREAREAVLAFVAAESLAAGAAAMATHGASTGAPGTSGTNAWKGWASLKGSVGVGGVILGAAVGAGGHAAYVAGSHDARLPVAAASASSIAVSAFHTVKDNHDWVAASGPPSVAPPPSTLVARPAALPVAPPLLASSQKEDASGNVGRDNLLGAERNLIDTARTAVARGDGEAALATLERHTREFPHGRLAEEREWLTIQALVLSSRAQEAREHATGFRRSFPHSLMLPALDQVVGP